MSESPHIGYVNKLLETYGKNLLKLSWEEQNLPDFPNLPEVRIPKEKMQKWRDMYVTQGIFIGNILGKHNWSMLDLIDYSHRNFKEVPNAQ